MDIYIDLSNLCSLANSLSDERFKICREMLREYFNLYFTFGKGDWRNKNKQVRDKIEQFIRAFTSNRGNYKIEWNKDCPIRQLAENSHDSDIKELLMSVYLLADENACIMEKQGCLLVGSVGNEIERLMNLCFNRKIKFSKQYYTRDMTDWHDIQESFLLSQIYYMRKTRMH